jgi:hypothetical protein
MDADLRPTGILILSIGLSGLASALLALKSISLVFLELRRIP